MGLVVCLSFATPAPGQRPLNLDFERAAVTGPDRPWGWDFGFFAFAHGKAASFDLDSAVVHHGTRSLRISLPDSASRDTPPQTIQNQIPAKFAHGRTLQLTGWLRGNSLNGRASVALEAWGDRVVVAADTATLVGTTTSWQQRAVRIRVPPDSTIHSIVITAMLAGRGVAHFDDFRLELDGVSITAIPPSASEPTPNDIEWLRQHASPVFAADPGSGVRDLVRFDSIVGDARIVALGESTHGTEEFFTVKHRLLRHLVEKRGFTVFAIEANQVAVQRVDRFVRFGEGSGREVLKAMFAVWNTEPMHEMVEWLRRYNVQNPQRMVRFVGYDLQDHRRPLDSLRVFLAGRDSALLARVNALRASYGSAPRAFTPSIADSVRTRWRVEADTVHARMLHGRCEGLAAAHSADDSLRVEWAVQWANLLRQATRLNETLNSPDRDRMMAENLEWLMSTIIPGEKVVLWAHDVHVSRGGDPATSFNAGEQMGAYLSRRYGDDYRTFSLLTFDGEYTATRSFNDFAMIRAAAFPAPSVSLEGALHRLRRPKAAIGWVVDLRPARTALSGAWLRQRRPVRHIGFAAYDYGFDFEVVLPQEFDGVVFLDHTTASRLLR